MSDGSINILIVDGLGVGASHDSKLYGDSGANTIRLLTGRNFPELGNELSTADVDRENFSYFSLSPDKKGKGTTTGHWNLFGLSSSKELVPMVGKWPDGLLEIVRNACGYTPLHCGFHDNGTSLVRELGDVASQKSKIIAYSSSDAIIQLAANEEKLSLDDLRNAARKLSESNLTKFGLGRVITRPFKQVGGSFQRTKNRMDFHATPEFSGEFFRSYANYITPVLFGKAIEIFGWCKSAHRVGSPLEEDCIEKMINHVSQKPVVRICNYRWIDDLLHLGDLDGARNCFGHIYEKLWDFMKLANGDDVYFVVADHGCDITININENTREKVPLLVFGGSKSLHEKASKISKMSEFVSLVRLALDEKQHLVATNS